MVDTYTNLPSAFRRVRFFESINIGTLASYTKYISLDYLTDECVDVFMSEQVKINNPPSIFFQNAVINFHKKCSSVFRNDHHFAT